MSHHHDRLRTILSVAALTLVLTAGAVAAQGEYSVLGLSAAPDAYVDDIDIEYGQDFQLYVIIAGPGAVEPLTLDFVSVNWAVLQACCGGSPAFLIDSNLHTDQLDHEGDPIYGVHTSAPTCIDAEIITVATLTFTWLYEPTGPFLLGAASMSAAEFCGGETEFLSGCSVRIAPLGYTPAEDHTWGEVKSIYR
jgi:hypothetical protein